MPRQRDLAFEALVEATQANVAMERGRLNTALAAIRHAWESEGGRPEDLHEEIPRRAEAYRQKMPSMMLTPTALAVHWKRVIVQQQNRSPQQQALDELRKEKPE